MRAYTRQIVSILVGFIVVFAFPGTSTLSTIIAIATGVAVGSAANAVLARIAPPTPER